MFTMYPINSGKTPFLSLEMVAQRRISLESSSQDATTQGVFQRALDHIIHFFMYHFNPNYQSFYDGLRSIQANLLCKEGMNLHGMCQNNECENFKKQIYINKGFGEFDWVKEQARAYCAMCKKAIQVENCVFKNCNGQITGAKKQNHEELKYKVQALGDQLVTCQEFANEYKDEPWAYVQITTSQLI